MYKKKINNTSIICNSKLLIFLEMETVIKVFYNIIVIYK